MSTDTEAAEVATEFRSTLSHASGKAWHKWRASIESGQVMFTSGDLDQWALEGLLTIAGLYDSPGTGSNKGQLRALLAKGGERYLQAALDFYLGHRAQKEAAQARAAKRGGGRLTLSLDQPVYEDSDANAAETGTRMETSDQAATSTSLRWPALYLTRDLGLTKAQAMQRLGLSEHFYRAQLASELEDFTAWAYRNRRVTV